MYACRQVMMEFRNADSRHVDWVKALKQLFQQLKVYVKQHHMAGPSWNPRGIPLPDFKADNNANAASNPAPAVASASAPKPPPPGMCWHLITYSLAPYHIFTGPISHIHWHLITYSLAPYHKFTGTLSHIHWHLITYSLAPYHMFTGT